MDPISNANSQLILNETPKTYQNKLMTETKITNEQILQVLLAECTALVEETICKLEASDDISPAQCEELMKLKIEFILD